MNKKKYNFFKHYKNCVICEHNCQINRKIEVGFCATSDKFFISSVMTHIGEEKIISPTLAIFISGCNAKCNFCYNSETAFDSTKGVEVSPQMLAKQIDFEINKNPNIKTVSFLGGDPIPHLPKVIETVSLVQGKTKFVLNSNFYFTEKVLVEILDYFQVFLVDFKFGSDACAEKIAQLPNYTKILERNLKILQNHNQFEKILIRHLLMPNHFDCCTKPIMEWLSDNFRGVKFSLLEQFVGNDKLNEREVEQAKNYLKTKNLCNLEVVI